MDATSAFHKLWIVDALSRTDSPTGRKLYDDLHVLVANASLPLELGYLTPKTNADMLGAFRQIRDEAEGLCKLPMIHIECPMDALKD